MSKYTEAMSSIIYTMHFRVKPKYLGHVEDENMDLMYELAEKATPKKVIKMGMNSEYSSCPKCGQFVNCLENFCHCCGQQLDWSDYNNHKI